MLYAVGTNKSIHYYYGMKNDNNEIGNKISKKIRLERNKRNLSQKDLALIAGIDKNTIWKIETGQVSPTINTLEKITKAFNMDFNLLMDLSKVDLQ